jgi:hypothetical protein
MFLYRWLSVGLMCVLGASSGPTSPPTEPTATERNASLDGFWQSDGYGLLLEIHGQRLDAFQITAISCLHGWTATRPPVATDQNEIMFRMEGANSPRILVTPDTLPGWKCFRIPESAASRIRFHRLDRPPEIFSRKVQNTSLTNFDIFWTTFAEQYPFFAVRGVDWNRTKTVSQSGITSETTRSELFRIFRGMLAPLHDGHISLQAKGLPSFNGRRRDPHPLSANDFRRVAEIIETKYVRGGLRSMCNQRVGYGSLSDSIAYVRIVGFGAMTEDRDFAHGTAALEEALDTIFRDSSHWRGLVIDVRANRGGSGLHGLQVANRLATREYLGYMKRARNDPADPTHLTPAQASRVHMSSRPHFEGKVVLLTGRHTVSAGETFTMALMGRTPRVIRVGENTQGMFSDVLWRDLPNGFSFGLPNEIFLSEEGKCFEATGIPPDVVVDVFPPNDLQAGKDTALDKALALLAAKG